MVTTKGHEEIYYIVSHRNVPYLDCGTSYTAAYIYHSSATPLSERVNFMLCKLYTNENLTFKNISVICFATFRIYP